MNEYIKKTLEEFDKEFGTIVVIEKNKSVFGSEIRSFIQQSIQGAYEKGKSALLSDIRGKIPEKITDEIPQKERCSYHYQCYSNECLGITKFNQAIDKVNSILDGMDKKRPAFLIDDKLRKAAKECAKTFEEDGMEIR